MMMMMMMIYKTFLIDILFNRLQLLHALPKITLARCTTRQSV